MVFAEQALSGGRLGLYSPRRYLVRGPGRCSAASTLSPDVRDKCTGSSNVETAKLVGAEIGKRAIEKNITKVVFDRGGYLYHGKVKALAESAREAGLEF